MAVLVEVAVWCVLSTATSCNSPQVKATLTVEVSRSTAVVPPITQLKTVAVEPVECLKQALATMRCPAVSVEAGIVYPVNMLTAELLALLVVTPALGDLVERAR